MRLFRSPRVILLPLLVLSLCAASRSCPDRSTPCVGDTRGGSYLWAKQIGGDERDWASGVAAFPDGSCVVVGEYEVAAAFATGEPSETTIASLDYCDMFIAAYDPDGNLKWVKHARAEGYYEASFVDALDDGSSLVACRFAASEPLGEVHEDDTLLTLPDEGNPILVKLDADGALLWTAHVTGEDFYLDGMSAAPDGSCVLIGGAPGSVTFGEDESAETTLGKKIVDFSDFYTWTAFVAKYNHDGTLAWVRSVETEPPPGMIQGVSVAPGGSCFVSGRFVGSATFGLGEPNETQLRESNVGLNTEGDIFVAKYNPNGSLNWAKNARSRAWRWGEEAACGVSAAPDGGCFVTGLLHDGRTTFGADEPNSTTLTVDRWVWWGSFFVARYGPDGQLLWATKADNASGNAVAAISDGSCIVAGTFSRDCVRFEAVTGQPISVSRAHQLGNEGWRTTAFLVKYSKDGMPIWTKYIDGGDPAPPYTDVVIANSRVAVIDVLSDGSCIAAGHFHDYAIFGFGETNALRIDVFGYDGPGSYTPDDAFVAKFPP